MKEDTSTKTVFVGMSGGVDSSVSAYLLKKAGYRVVGVFLRVWYPDWLICGWRDERRDAMRVAAHLQIPFITIDCEREYKEAVIDRMIADYEKGNTPNPDVLCNREVKFGIFWQKAKEMGADYIATGHYALRGEDASLHVSPDGDKDQSYFLWKLTSQDLEHVLFPVGEMHKSQVREIARKAHLPVAEKKDSQGLCFLGQVDMRDFLKRYITHEPGRVATKDGEIVGVHEGVRLYTLGERHGFMLTKHAPDDAPLYVVCKDITKNILVVAPNPEKLLERCDARLDQLSWVKHPPVSERDHSLVSRYHAPPVWCRVEVVGGEARITTKEPVLFTPGQSVVIYDETRLVGGGMVA